MAFYTNSAIHMLAHGAWAQALMLAGAAELGLVRGKLHEPLVAARGAARVRGLRRRVPRPRAEHWFFARSAFLHHLIGWTLVVGRARPARAASSGRARSCCTSGFARRDRRGRGDALLRPRRGAGLRPPLAARGGAAPVRRLAGSPRSSRSPRRRPAWAHATLQRDVAGVPGASSQRGADDDPPALRPERDALPGSVAGARRARAQTTRGPRAAHGRRRRRAGAAAAGGRRTRCAGTRSRPTSHVVSGVWTFGVAREGAAADRGRTARGGPTRTRARRALAVLPRARAARSARSASGCSCLRGLPLPPRLERRLYRRSPGSACVGVLEVGIARVLPALPRTCCSCRSCEFLYGDLSPIADGTRFGRGVHRDDARLRARRRRSSTSRGCSSGRVLLWPAFVLALGFVSGLSLSGHDAVDPGSSWTTELADWVHLSAASLWVGGLVDARGRGLAGRAGAAARRRSSASPGWRSVLVALVLAAGIYLAHRAAAAPRRPVDARATARCCW